MSRQITPSRYHHAQIRDHLASQYLLGLLTPRVRRRFEVLLERDPGLWALIDQWQQRLDDERRLIVPPPARVWRNIRASTGSPRGHGWRRWLFNSGWLAAGALLMFLTLTPMTQPIKPVSYVAMMSSESCRDCFVLMAWQGDKPGRSSIRVQYGEHSSPAGFSHAGLWARDKTSGALVYLAPMRQLQNMHYLTPAKWQQLKNSDQLLVMENGRALYSGKCITL